MFARNPDVPLLSYLVAVVVGLFGLPFMGMAVGFVEELTDGGFHEWTLVVAAGFIVVHAVLGAAFGLLWPEARWRWGMWLCGVPACLVSLTAPGVLFFMVWCALTLLPACAGAHVAATLHLRYMEVE